MPDSFLFSLVGTQVCLDWSLGCHRLVGSKPQVAHNHYLQYTNTLMLVGNGGKHFGAMVSQDYFMTRYGSSLGIDDVSSRVAAGH